MKLPARISLTADVLGGVALTGALLSLAEAHDAFGAISSEFALQSFGYCFTAAVTAFAVGRLVQLTQAFIDAPDYRRVPATATREATEALPMGRPAEIPVVPDLRRAA